MKNKDILPDEIVNREKKNFTPPLADWILKEKYSNEVFNKVEILEDIDYGLYKFFEEKIFTIFVSKLFK